MKRLKEKTILLGEGVHQHTLYGEFEIEETDFFPDLVVVEQTLLKHEHPNKSFGEHKGLMVNPGHFEVARQVEYDPFTELVRQIRD